MHVWSLGVDDRPRPAIGVGPACVSGRARRAGADQPGAGALRSAAGRGRKDRRPSRWCGFCAPCPGACQQGRRTGWSPRCARTGRGDAARDQALLALARPGVVRQNNRITESGVKDGCRLHGISRNSSALSAEGALLTNLRLAYYRRGYYSRGTDIAIDSPTRRLSQLDNWLIEEAKGRP
jgi:hypothetical protein